MNYLFDRSRVLLLLLLLLAACAGQPAAPGAAPTAIGPTPPASAVVETAVTPSSPPEEEGAPITAETLDRLASVDLALPAWPTELFWPRAGAALPGAPEPFPDLLIYDGESTLYPLALRPPAYTPPALGAPLPVTGLPGAVMAIAPDGASLLLRPDDGVGASLYNWRGDRLHTFEQPELPYTAAYSPDGHTLAIGSGEDWQVFVYDLENLTPGAAPAAVLGGFETAAPVYSVQVAPGGGTLAWIARASLQFTSIPGGETGAQLGFMDFIGPALFSPDGRRMALQAAGRLELYTVPDGDRLAGIDLGYPLHSLAFSPDGRLLAGGYGSGIQFWDGETLAPLTTLDAGSPAGQVSFSPGGETLVSVHEEMAVRVWRLGD